MVSLGNISINDIYIGSTQANAAYIGTTKVWPESPAPTEYQGLCFKALEPNSSVQLTSQGTPSNVISLQTSTDGVSWSSYTPGTSIPLDNVGDKVYFAATEGIENTSFFTNDYNYFHFAGTGKHSASGILHSVLKHDCTQRAVPYNGCAYLFCKDSALVDASELDIYATSLDYSAYNCLFRECTNLLSGPAELSTDAILSNYAYSGLFYQCSNLVKAPIIRDVVSVMAEDVDRTFNAAFMNCSKLAELEVHFTTWTYKYFQFNDWVRAISDTGTFKCPATLPLEFSNRRIPLNWDTATI